MSIWQRLHAPFVWLHNQSFLGRIRVMAVLIGCFAPVAFWNSHTLAERVAAIEASEAVAKAVVTKAVYGKKRHRTWVRYTFADRLGGQYEGSQSHIINLAHLKPGSQIEIFYSTRDPRQNAVDRPALRLEATRTRDASWIFLTIGLLALLPYGRLGRVLRPA